MSIDQTPVLETDSNIPSKATPEGVQLVSNGDAVQPSSVETTNESTDDSTPVQGEGEADHVTDEENSTKAQEQPGSTDKGTSEKHDQRFQELASSFLAAHRREVSQRDGEIYMLKAELAAIQEANAASLEQAPKAEIEGLLNHLSSSVLLADDYDEIGQNLEQIWARIFAAVKSAMHSDMPDDCSATWQQENLCPLLEEKIDSISMIAPLLANRTSATEGRVIVIMAILAQFLEDYIFTPEYLLEDDDDLRYLLRASKHPLIKQGLRSMLLLTSDVDDWKRTIIKKRISNALDELHELVKTLLPQDMSTVLRNNLELELETVASIWERGQRSQSHFEVNTNPGASRWTWKSISSIAQGLILTDVDSSEFEASERVMVVFPRVFALDRSQNPSFTPVFTGIILQESRVESLQAKFLAQPPESVDPAVVPPEGAPSEGQEPNLEIKEEVVVPPEGAPSEGQEPNLEIKGGVVGEPESSLPDAGENDPAQS